ncbi:MAG TPA: hypothetical protein PK760_12870, partial [Flavobacteriales bacterium]|nr:hypothetical protein [Flavobacteriales bacterium]
MWTYEQTSGVLIDPSGKAARTKLYSGFERGKNNPRYEYEKGIGPIPHGEWTITGPPYNTDT